MPGSPAAPGGQPPSPSVRRRKTAAPPAARAGLCFGSGVEGSPVLRMEPTAAVAGVQCTIRETAFSLAPKSWLWEPRVSRAPLGLLPGPHLMHPESAGPGAPAKLGGLLGAVSLWTGLGLACGRCWHAPWHSLAMTQTLTFLCPRPAGTHRAENMKRGLVWVASPSPRAVCRGGVQPPLVLAPSCQVTSRGAFVWREASQIRQ